MILKAIVLLILVLAGLMALYIVAVCKAKGFNYRIKYLEYFIYECKVDETSRKFIEKEFSEIRFTPDEKPRVMSAFAKFQKKFKL